MGTRFDVITSLFHCSVIMHCFQNWFQVKAHFFCYVQIQFAVEFALLDEHKDFAFLIWDIFCAFNSQSGD